MKNQCLLKSLLFLCCSLLLLCGSLPGCSKSSQAPASLTPSTSISFKANDSVVAYPVDLVFIQDVDSTHTTLISGQFADTSARLGSLALRLIGDTTGRFSGSNLLVTYMDGNDSVYYLTSDSSNYVQIDKYPKTYKGLVSGSFSFAVQGNAGRIQFSNGSIIALYQQ